MKRGLTGRYTVTRESGEEVRAFTPRPLPPDPPLALDGRLQSLLEKAHLALGRLDGLSTLLPNSAVFLYPYVRKEAVLSSQIEGTQSSLSDLLLFELDELPGIPVDEVVEVSNYVAAMEHGLARLRGGFPLSSRLIREIHGVLLSRGRGSEKEPGEFRRSQNWIGGTRPGTAVFVPPPVSDVLDCVSDLERFLHDDSRSVPALLKAGMVHAQFETIHPFLDGNGRVGRLLTTFLLCHEGVLREPMLYLSLYLKQHRAEYYRLLQQVRIEGDWEAWLQFFLKGVEETASGAVATAKRLVDLFASDRERIQAVGRAAGSALRVHAALQARPLAGITRVAERTGLSFPAASAGMAVLVELDVAREVTGRKRKRVFAYGRYIEILNEGAGPL